MCNEALLREEEQEKESILETIALVTDHGRPITLDLLAPDPFRIMLSKGGSLWKL